MKTRQRRSTRGGGVPNDDVAVDSLQRLLPDEEQETKTQEDPSSSSRGGNGEKNDDVVVEQQQQQRHHRVRNNSSSRSAPSRQRKDHHHDNKINASSSSSICANNDGRLAFDPRVIRALEEARYEARVDPYRGIVPYFAVSYPEEEEEEHDNNRMIWGVDDDDDGRRGQQHNSSPSIGEIYGYNGEGCGNYNATMTTIEEEGSKGPWAECAGVLGNVGSWKFERADGEEEEEAEADSGDGRRTATTARMEVVNVDDDDDENNEDLRNNNGGVGKGEDAGRCDALVVRCGCPSADGWAEDEREAYVKQRRLAEKRKKKKKQKKQQQKRSTAARGRKRKCSGDDDDAGGDCDDAIIAAGDGKATSSEGDDGGRSSSSGCGPRLMICGERGEGRSCPCDHNPFCLASLGGVVDHYRRSAAKVANSVGTTAKHSKLIHDDVMASLDSSSKKAGGKNGKKDEEGGLRRSVLVNCDAVRDHVSRFICADRGDVGGGDTAVAMRLNDIQSLHEPLVLRPRRRLGGDDEDGMAELSVPPGLRNLGATCYLNSQLQCLAQNLGFVRGLFSWKSPPSGTTGFRDRMSTVLSSMQSILARMRRGPDRVICTNEFASALCLENDEMQDPNEFARLLFDRMSESFRRSAELALGSEGNCLGDLLPSVFGGTFAYVTKCQSCGMISKREEDFMELSIPIVDCKEESPSGKKKRKQPGKVKQDHKPTAPARDVDVQLCMNSYLHPEILDGDNQYECSRCQRKCDATRKMIFAKLPPVLNIQLARYVFDRETLSKRKLTTKVLLPKSLEIPDQAISDGRMQTKYILCAVQNHLGSSAHGGHYVADVMDWTTGVWYEFNDEDVTVLQAGPKSSFDPNETEDDAAGTDRLGERRKVGGSADAYNLFYVEACYLSRRCQSELRPFHSTESKAVTGSSAALGDCSDILSTVEDQRKQRYRDELEIQTREKLLANRIRARQQQIMKTIFLPTSRLDIPTYSKGNKIWVDSAFLRRFFSCQDGLEDIFRKALNPSALETVMPFLRNNFLCEHQTGLHPRVARKGKLLPLEMYEAVERIMRKEYATFVNDNFANFESMVLSEMCLADHRFVDGGNDGTFLIQCKHCGKSYQKEARRKYDLFETLISLHDDLIAGNNDLDPSTLEEPSNVYAISRTWATSFRKYVEKKVTELQLTPQKKSLHDKNNGACGGIDVLDLSEVEDGESSYPGKTSDSFKGEDPTSKITCHHGCCPMMNSRKSVRIIPEKVWRKISRVFSDATPHCFELPRDDAIGNCVKCFTEKEEESLFPQKLRDWKRAITQPGALSDLLKRGKQMNQFYPSSEINLVIQHSAQDSISLYALHHMDVQRWRDTFRAIEKSLKSKKKNDAITKQLNELLFVSSDVFGREWKFQQLTCKKHNMAVGVPSFSPKEDVRNWLGKLYESNVELLLSDEYQELMGSLATLESILHGEGSPPLKESCPLSVLIHIQDGAPTIKTDPQICTSGCHATSFSDELIEDVPAVSKQNSKHSKPVNATESIDDGPKGPLCKVFVHQVENGMDIAVSASQIMLNVADHDAPLSSSANGRPSRSRKARGEGGGGSGFPVDEVEMALDGNLAHFRLLLHQSKGKKLFGQQLFLLRGGTFASEHRPLDLLPSSNHKTIHEIISGSTVIEASNPEHEEDCTVHLILSYKGGDTSNSDGMRRSTRKRVSQEEKEEEENLLTSMTEIACGGWKTADADDVVIRGKTSKRRRQEERGFQGTFLHQSSGFDAPADPLLPEDTDIPESLEQADSKDIVFSVVGSSQIENNVACLDAPDGPVLPRDTKISEKSEHDDSKELVIVDVLEDGKEIARACSDDDCETLQRERIHEELTRAVQMISNCTQPSNLHYLKEQIFSAISGPDGTETASTAVRQALVQHITTQLKQTDKQVSTAALQLSTQHNNTQLQETYENLSPDY